MEKFDIIVIGLGAHGSATTYQLAKRGINVLGIDQLAPPHAFGSSHGDTRITRPATGEGSKYAELSLRSYALWREIEKETDEDLYSAVGVLNIANGSAGLFKNVVAIATKFHIPCETLTATQIRDRFPQFAIADTDIGYFEPGAGFLRPEACIRSQLALAKKYRASVRLNERVASVAHQGQTIIVETDKGEYTADKVVISVGAWITDLIDPEYAGLFSVTRQVLYWFDIEESPERFALGTLPVFICDPRGNKTGFYGFPAVDGAHGGIKVARQQREQPATANTINRAVSDEEKQAMYENFVGQYLPDLSPRCLRATTCLYTNTPDSNFIIDWLPGSEDILIASPCSGHGFKHSAAIGEVLAQLVTSGRSDIDVAEFSLSRFT